MESLGPAQCPKVLEVLIAVHSFLCSVWQYEPQSHCTMSHREASLLCSACYKLSCGRMRIQIVFATSIHIVDQVPDAVFKLSLCFANQLPNSISNLELGISKTFSCAKLTVFLRDNTF